jgi:hypothetical protein
VVKFIPVEDLPEDAITSEHAKENAEVYAEVLYFGDSYYIPITRKVKKAFNMKRRGKKILMSCNDHILFDDFVRDIINSVYLQVRDTVGAGIYRQLSGEVKSGLEKLFSNQLMGTIGNGFEQRQIGAPDGKEE